MIPGGPPLRQPPPPPPPAPAPRQVRRPAAGVPGRRDTCPSAPPPLVPGTKAGRSPLHPCLRPRRFPWMRSRGPLERGGGGGSGGGGGGGLGLLGPPSTPCTTPVAAKVTEEPAQEPRQPAPLGSAGLHRPPAAGWGPPIGQKGAARWQRGAGRARPGVGACPGGRRGGQQCGRRTAPVVRRLRQAGVCPERGNSPSPCICAE
jgi:hypothetical protein